MIKQRQNLTERLALFLIIFAVVAIIILLVTRIFF